MYQVSFHCIDLKSRPTDYLKIRLSKHNCALNYFKLSKIKVEEETIINVHTTLSSNIKIDYSIIGTQAAL